MLETIITFITANKATIVILLAWATREYNTVVNAGGIKTIWNNFWCGKPNNVTQTTSTTENK